MKKKQIKKNGIFKETFRGKPYLILRDEKGKAISRRKWSSSKDKSKRFTLEEAHRKFRRDRSLKEGVSMTRLSKVREYVDVSKTPLIRTKFQAFTKIIYKGGSVEARSQQHTKPYPIKKAKAESLESAYELLAQKFNLEYDAEEGERVFNGLRNSRIQQGVVSYAEI